jgi:DNA adenine methylase
MKKQRAFLKWAGGKYSLIESITEFLPTGNVLVEPFVGAGSVFLNTDYDAYLLADINPDLIALYNLLKTEPAPTNGSTNTLPVGKNSVIDSIRLYLPPAHFKNARCFFMIQHDSFQIRAVNLY